MNTNVRHIVARFMEATAGEIQSGKEWYLQAYRIAARIAREHEISPERVAAVIAALSPNNKWERNTKDAENVIAAYIKGGAKDAMAVKVCTYGKNLAKAISILEADDYDSFEVILSGPKVIEFYHCIIGQDDVCIDGHAYSIWFGERLTMKEVPSIGKKLRESIKNDYMLATEAINGLMADEGESFTCYQIQAITWVAHKRIYGV